MSEELDIQKIAEDLIRSLHEKSRVYGQQADRAKWMAEGARELHDTIRREATKLVPDGDGDAD